MPPRAAQTSRALLRQRLAPARAWLLSDALTHKNPIQPKYLDGDHPFPKNPYFKAIRPVQEDTKERIWKMWCRAHPTMQHGGGNTKGDGEVEISKNGKSKRTEERKKRKEEKENAEVTPETIAKMFGLSVNRIEAILRLKHEENKLVGQGYLLNHSLDREMQRMLSRPKEYVGQIPESAVQHQNLLIGGRPLFKTMGGKLSQLEAKATLTPRGLKSHLHLPIHNRPQKPATSLPRDPVLPFMLEPEYNTTTTILQPPSEKYATRRKWFVLDTTAGNTGVTMTIRDTDGSLRTANEQEVVQNLKYARMAEKIKLSRKGRDTPAKIQ